MCRQSGSPSLHFSTSDTGTKISPSLQMESQRWGKLEGLTRAHVHLRERAALRSQLALSIRATPCVLHRSAASPGSLSEMQILGHHTESETGVQPCLF